MKITRLGPTRPVIGIGGLLGGGTSGGGGAGTVPTATGSNGEVSWSSNVASITVNGTTQVLGPFVNIANGSNTVVTVDQVAAASSNTIRIHATGGAASFGSNATRVSEVSSVGAGSDSARTDHIHDGIGTITASSSNTMQRGTWNLRAGTGIALALTDADGDGEFDTTTIVNTGQTGGGGSLTVADEGTPLSTAATTLDFVGAGVTASGTGATKTITIPGGGGGGNSDLLLDFPPSSPDADDDEFPGTSLSGSWTDPLTSASGQTNLIVVANGWMVLEPATSGSSSTGKHVFGIRKASPSGSFSVSVKFVDGYGLGDSRPGVFVGVSGGKAHVCGPGSQDATPAMAIGVGTYSESADWSGFDGFLATAPHSNIIRHTGWYRIRWDASASTLYFDHSFNGVLWYNFTNRTSQSQPTSMGVCLYSNSGVIEAHHRLAVNWFRVIDGSAAF